MSSSINEVEKRLWRAADELRANSQLKSSEYSVPVLGLIFLRYASQKFQHAKEAIEAERGNLSRRRRRREVSKLDYQARGVIYLPEEARFSSLVALPEADNMGQAINQAMRAIERENEELKDVLPKTYNRINNQVLVSLLKNFNSIPMTIEGDAFGKIYEYFLGNFAMSEGQKGGEFFTPTAIVKLIVEIIEPFHGRIYDPACGSGGMFVQSARFVAEHQQNPNAEISIYGQEKVAETVRLCKMNLAVQGLSGDIRQAITYYEDVHRSVNKFDFVMANPPFNVDKVDKERIKDDPRFLFGIPRVDNANYLWIQLFYSALNAKGRAGFVMANSACDARASELEIRKELIQAGAVDVMVAVGSNFFYTVTLPCTLWFLDKGKQKERADGAEGAAKAATAGVLFIDARHIYRQLSRAHRDFSAAQIEFIANIVRLYRGEAIEQRHLLENATPNEANDALPSEERCGSQQAWQESFPDGTYRDVAGLCKLATIDEIKAQGWSLNPGRYVGVAERKVEAFDFFERLNELNEELEGLNGEARELEEQIAENVRMLLGGKS